MNESKVIILSILNPRHLACNLLDVDKVTLVGAVFSTRKMTWNNKPKISGSKISLKKQQQQQYEICLEEKKQFAKKKIIKNKIKIVGPCYYSTEFLFFKAIVNSKYSSILGTMLYFWLLKGMLRSIFCVDMNTHTDRK